jgi:hypothetical protein
MPFKAADEFRAAVCAGNYRAADRLLTVLRQEVEECWPTAGAEQRRTIAAQIRDLLAWARATVMVGRSHAQRRLAQLTRHSAYASPRGRANAQLEFEG